MKGPLARWLDGFSKLASDAKFICGISRKGARFLQFLGENHFFTGPEWEKIASKIVSENAISFMDSSRKIEGKHILVVDDAVINGTTFGAVCRSIHRQFEDVPVLGLPFAVSCCHNPEVRPFIYHYGLKLGESELERYMRVLVQGLASLSSPLHVTLPVIETEAESVDEAAEIVEHFAKKILPEEFAKRIFAEEHGKSHLPSHFRHSVFSQSGGLGRQKFPLEFPVWFVPLPETSINPFSRDYAASFKFYFDEKKKRLRIVPETALTFDLVLKPASRIYFLALEQQNAQCATTNTTS